MPQTTAVKAVQSQLCASQDVTDMSGTWRLQLCKLRNKVRQRLHAGYSWLEAAKQQLALKQFVDERASLFAGGAGGEGFNLCRQFGERCAPCRSF